MTPKQEQSAGDQSTNSQAGRDSFQAGHDLIQARGNVYQVGVTYDQARQIAIDVFEANFIRLVGAAADLARDRAEKIARDLLDALMVRNPKALGSMQDPDMLRALYAAQEGYACSGEEDLEKSLVDLLVDRAEQPERGTKALVLNQAIATLPKLSKSHRAALAVSFTVRHTRFVGPLELPALYAYLTESLMPFMDDLPEKASDLGYMQSMGVGARSLGSVTIEAAMVENAFGYFCSGFTREDAPEAWARFIGDRKVFIPCLRDQNKLQINARAMIDVRELSDKAEVPTLVPHAAIGRMKDPEIRADIMNNIPGTESLFKIWDEPVNMGHFELTSVGVAIGHACNRQMTGNSTPLDVFLP
jgi:hypothetical protein